jgi:DNA-binding transcriptional MerR regulator
MENNNKYATYYLFDSGVGPAKIAKELNIKLKDVRDILENRQKDNSSKSIKTTSSKVNSKNLMITETAAKGTKSVAIMTKAASEVNDEFKKKMDSTQSRTAKNAIFKPNK